MQVSRRGLSLSAGLSSVLIAALLGFGPAAGASSGPGWAQVKSPDVTGPLGALAAVACTSGTSCLAVGSGGAPAPNNVRPLAELWNGTRWSTAPAPVVTGPNEAFAGVACPSASVCLAVGGSTSSAGAASPVSEVWNGTAWTVSPTVVPTQGASLTSVACWSPTSCIAVGYSGSGLNGSPTAPLAESWNGSTWIVQTLPGPSAGGLYGVSCFTTTSAPECVAVGASSGAPLVETLRGSTWSVQTVPASTGVLLGIGCSSPQMCLTVGYREAKPGANVSGLSLSWNGTSWTEQTTAPSGGAQVLNSVSCPSTTDCEAVGYSDGRLHGSQPLAESWNSAGWSRQKTPFDPTLTDVSLNGVSCSSVGTCVAVGRNNFITTAESESGSTWIHEVTPPGTPQTTQGELGAVSCASTTMCVAIGERTDNINNGLPGGLLELWSGTAWKVEAGVDSRPSSLTGVSCPSATACMVVGDGRGGTTPFAEWWNGVTWSDVSPPLPASSNQAALTAVSCPSATSCEAVGTYEGSSGSQYLAETWNGSDWTFQTVPSPASSPFGSLNGISCPSPAECVAVGGPQFSNGTAFAEQLSGSIWSPLALPSPSGSVDSSMAGVSCTTPTACVAVGSWSGTDGGDHPLAETWNGIAWSISQLAPPPGILYGGLSSVSCTSGTCTATGSYDKADGRYLTLAEQWNGTSWAFQHTVSVGIQPLLAGVSCVSSIYCTAVGAVDEAGGPPLVETYS